MANFEIASSDMYQSDSKKAIPCNVVNGIALHLR